MGHRNYTERLCYSVWKMITFQFALFSPFQGTFSWGYSTFWSTEVADNRGCWGHNWTSAAIGFIQGTCWYRKKMGGGLHPILDLRQLNRYISKFQFHMLTLVSINFHTYNYGLVCYAWFKAHIFTFLSDRVSKSIFIVAQWHFQCKVLLFGLSTAVRVFTKCLSVVVAHLRKQDIIVHPYLDNWLFQAAARGVLLLHISYNLCPFKPGTASERQKVESPPNLENSFLRSILYSVPRKLFSQRTDFWKQSNLFWKFKPVKPRKWFSFWVWSVWWQLPLTERCLNPFTHLRLRLKQHWMFHGKNDTHCHSWAQQHWYTYQLQMSVWVCMHLSLNRLLKQQSRSVVSSTNVLGYLILTTLEQSYSSLVQDAFLSSRKLSARKWSYLKWTRFD